MTMRAKDYEHVAKVLGRLPLGIREETVSRMSETLASLNPEFNREKFAANAALWACPDCFTVSESPIRIANHRLEEHGFYDNKEEEKSAR
jgi:hypothetical protein